MKGIMYFETKSKDELVKDLDDDTVPHFDLHREGSQESEEGTL
jgi:hypothetical protein